MSNLSIKNITGLLILVFSISFSSCQNNSGQAGESDQGVKILEAVDAPPLPDFAYNLNEPDHKTKLPSALTEVSGLGYFGEGKVAMVQDEKANIYIFDEALDSVVSKYKFGFAGDFEGIEIQGNTAFIIRSDGMLYEVVDFMAEEPTVNKFQTPLSPATNPEGLGYLAAESLFIIAGKEEYFDVANDEKIDTLRAFYAYNAVDHQLNITPHFTVNLNEIKKFISTYAQTKKEREWANEFNPKKAASFKPSGISQHPITQDIYITASAGKMLVVLDKDFNFTQAHYLSRDVYKQPEGISFSPDGTLYISNEGRDGKGNILRFKQK